MPTYEYACTECGHRFEQVQSFHDDALTHCPECEGRLRKIFNAVGVVFKGSGFYRTDSRAGSTAALAGSNSESGSEGGSGSKDGSGTKDGSRTKEGSAAKDGSGSSGGTKASDSSAAGGSSSSSSSTAAAPAS